MVVAVAKSLGAKRRRHRLLGLRRGHQDADARGGEPGTAGRATTPLAHWAFVNQISLRGSE